ncbi:DUF262 domain-containing protein [Gracilibacillus kekensis]|uniref:GmrSD restriction endonucleases N-terminal domain-containing protein n=1 Tax=Gracilibacillus kekensis TaxID=1027249 RepID=A0A1M7QQG6_9BACI|nr:DUF262 domain-containing protein [Gracilibacillus kekensis]SHN33796.1 Protein of unknown function DUF262 [Gracilibacillus kekensis]
MKFSEGRGELYSFYQLMNEYVIEIPIIQRDYAQGRLDKIELRNEFLQAIKSALFENKPINLDFIYGSTTNGILQPLDGQQRLTTLFLLHWYAAVKDKTLNEKNKEILSKFTYETRASSREFCQALIDQSIQNIDENTTISLLIKDSNWYFLSWNHDPTIDGMLRTIDHIHTLFNDLPDLWELLVSDENIISFYHIELKNFGLSDDLYIKMNARGKALTSFENFKASFEKQISDKKWDVNKDFEETFSCKVDTKWTDLFWKHRSHRNGIDEAMIRFFSSIAMISSAIEKTPNRTETIRSLQNDPRAIRPGHFSGLGYNYLHRALDVFTKLYENDHELKVDVPYGSYITNGDIFRTLVYNTVNASYTQKVIFFAQTEYILRNPEIDLVLFEDWMRVVRNIVNRGDIERSGSKASIVRSPESFDGAINLINELATGCSNIYEFLVTHTVTSQFAKSQIEEEQLKARLIGYGKHNKKAIVEAENIDFFSGRISLLFECIDFDGRDDSFNLDKFLDVANVFRVYIDNEITDKLRRALLTISTDSGDNNYYDYWWSWSYAVDANKRCLITKKSELEYYVYGNYKSRDEYKQYLIKLVQQLVDYNLDEIIDMFEPPVEMPNWKKRLIKEPNLLSTYCKSKYIAIPESEKCCYLLKGVRPRDIDSCFKVQ